MPISEDQLDTWAKQGSVTQSRDTYAAIKNVLEASGTPYADKSYELFLQGSYCNDTNVYAESDVDVVMKLNSTFYHDLGGLKPDEVAAYSTSHSDATYGFDQFKAGVIAVLKRKYGSEVEVGKKAIRVRGSGGRRDADVVACAAFRRYYSYKHLSEQRYAEGICFFLPDDTRIENFPKQHSANCTSKHQATNSWFKPTVRIIKNMRNCMLAEGLITKSLAPSYFLEGLFYNVPNDKFGSSYGDTFVRAINWIKDADRSQFVCANELYYLLRDTFVTWSASSCDQFLLAVTKFWNEW